MKILRNIEVIILTTGKKKKRICVEVAIVIEDKT